MNKSRDYKKEYRRWTKAQHEQNSMRKRDRRKMGLKTGDPREVDHRRSLKNGGTNHRNNLHIVARSTNRKKGAK